MPPNARVLYWNINNFTERKIVNFNDEKPHPDLDWDAGPMGKARLDMILSTLKPRDPGTGAVIELDFIVIVEVYARTGGAIEGALIGGSGLAGCITLLNELNRAANHVPGHGSWSLVPPVVTGTGGRREGIAVYYNSQRWHFLGPETRPANYPDQLRNGLPDRDIPHNYPYRANQSERRSAGKWSFTKPMIGIGPSAAPIYFPDVGHRKPWLTAFGRVGNPNLLVRLLSIHTTPNDHRNHIAYADEGTKRISEIPEMTTDAWVANQQIDVILGDFNVDNLDPANFALGGPFYDLMALASPYAPLIRPPDGLDDDHLTYYHTHGKTASDRPGDGPARIIDDLDDEPGPLGNYPGLEYSNASIDNILVRYRDANIRPADYRTSILARARAVAYRPPDPLPAPAPMVGYYEKTPWMDTSISEFIDLCEEDPDWAHENDVNAMFRSIDNYGLVYSVSDHFALLTDI